MIIERKSLFINSPTVIILAEGVRIKEKDGSSPGRNDLDVLLFLLKISGNCLRAAFVMSNKPSATAIYGRVNDRAGFRSTQDLRLKIIHALRSYSRRSDEKLL